VELKREGHSCGTSSRGPRKVNLMVIVDDAVNESSGLGVRWLRQHREYQKGEYRGLVSLIGRDVSDTPLPPGFGMIEAHDD